ncbi:MAG: OsmC family protein [Elusimicrobiota bacterium]|jgi:uncharacterized OsmC-like protein|nr:OsmC family protein [Elusimicrobiota bacterium]
MPKSKFTGNKKVEMEVNGFTLQADLPKEGFGGDNSAPDPMALLQAALLSCASIHALFFIDKINYPKEKVTLELKPVFNENGDITKASILIYVPADFPQDKEKLLISIVENCKVGTHVKFPREIIIVRH